MPINVSAEVLDGISHALRLTSDERRHLFLLAGLAFTRAPLDEEHVSELVSRVLEGLDPLPAYVRGRRWDVLAFNESFDALTDFSSATGPARNLVWRLFRDPESRCRYGDPECTMRRAVAQFRAVAAKYPTDPRFAELIGDLQIELRGVSPALGRTRRPRLDRRAQALQSSRSSASFILDTTTFELPGDGDIRMIVLTAAAGSETEQKLQRLTVDLALR